MIDEAVVGEAGDPDGRRVVVPRPLWEEKLLRDHPEVGPHLADVLRAVAEPDHVAVDPAYEQRRRYYLQDAVPVDGCSSS